VAETCSPWHSHPLSIVDAAGPGSRPQCPDDGAPRPPAPDGDRPRAAPHERAELVAPATWSPSARARTSASSVCSCRTRTFVSRGVMRIAIDKTALTGRSRSGFGIDESYW